MTSEHFTSGAVEAAAELAAALNPRAGETVCIATPHLDTTGWNYTESLVRMFAYDKAHGNHLLHESGLMNNGSFAPIWGRSVELSHARNTGAAAFLSSDSDWLLWIDSDMGFEPDALEKLMSVADPETAPVVGALCFIEGDYGHDFHGGLRSSLAPTLYDWAWVEPKNGMPGAYKMVTRQDWTPDEVTRVGATGTGMLLTHRSVYEKIARWLQEHGAPPHIWFERIPGPDGEKCGEDISFCLRVHQVGLPVLVHTGVQTTHQKTVWYGVADYHQKPFTPPPSNVRLLPPDQWPQIYVNPHAMEQAARTSPIREKQVPEADTTVAIIVPVAKRNNSDRFLTSLVDSLTPGQRQSVHLYVMGDRNDADTTIEWLSQVRDIPMVVDAHDYLREMGSFAEKVNRGYEISGEERWLFIVGDDVVFHRGWLDQAVATADETNCRVIGTNDLGNALVMAGEHGTHLLIRRDYVDTIGASWDGPGVVCHEGYRHWYVDNEIVEAAKQRGEWASSRQSHVEHMHPLWGKGQFDEVYQIGRDAIDADAALWVARAQRYDKIENEGE